MDIYDERQIVQGQVKSICKWSLNILLIYFNEAFLLHVCYRLQDRNQIIENLCVLLCFPDVLKISHTNLVLGSDVSMPTIFDTRILNTNGALLCLSQELNLHWKKNIWRCDVQHMSIILRWYTIKFAQALLIMIGELEKWTCKRHNDSSFIL
jgi:hypothetical protein